ncbi:MAG: hypothetical protein LBF54_04380 [Holosporaceae bacterium]|nr:hypothetical protein [Holosporaceae bacterium]
MKKTTIGVLGVVLGLSGIFLPVDGMRRANIPSAGELNGQSLNIATWTNPRNVDVLMHDTTARVPDNAYHLFLRAIDYGQWLIMATDLETFASLARRGANPSYYQAPVDFDAHGTTPIFLVTPAGYISNMLRAAEERQNEPAIEVPGFGMRRRSVRTMEFNEAEIARLNEFHTFLDRFWKQ